MKFVTRTRPKLPLVRSILFGVFIAVFPVESFAVPMNFDQMIGQTTGRNVLGPTSGDMTIFFKDVASENGQTVDARISTTLTGDTHFADRMDPSARNYFGDPGYIPNYNNRAGGPQGDLGFLYYGNGVNTSENGLDMTMEFFNGTGELTGTFLEPITLSSLEIAIYDVDGETYQSEFFTAFLSDGLKSYANGTTEQALTATESGNTIRFDGPGKNYSEDDATGAAILYYELTDALRLSFGSVQSSGPSQNAVFSAIDGDLSLFSDAIFGQPNIPAAVPLPASGVLLLTAFAACFAAARGSASV